MKKLLIVTIAAVMLFGSVSTLAAGIDLSEYSIDELIQLRTEITEELMDRDEIKTAKIPTGDYKVGEDFPAGVYSMTTNQIMVVVTINDYEDLYTVAPDSPVGKITLKDGQDFSCTGPVELTVYSGIVFE